MRDTTTLWVCVECIMHLANGECGGCYEDDNHGGMPPLGLLADAEISLGSIQEMHGCGRADDEYFGPCDCEYRDFSWSQCQGCGSMLGGERHAVTLWIY